MKRGLGKRGEVRLLDERPVAHSFNFRRRSGRIKKVGLIQDEYVSPTKEEGAFRTKEFYFRL
jgi:hypothetical protein